MAGSEDAKQASQLDSLTDLVNEKELDKVKAKGATVTKLGPEEAARWKEATTPIVDKWLADMEANGISNAREIYDAMKAEIAKVEGN